MYKTNTKRQFSYELTLDPWVTTDDEFLSLVYSEVLMYNITDQVKNISKIKFSK